MQSEHAPTKPLDTRPRFEIADVLRLSGEAYRRKHRLTPQQGKVLRALESCRTAALGGHLEVCTACGLSRPAYNSCRDRHCPKCQSLAQARWVEERMERVLPIPYFHVVFTLPSELRDLAQRNRRLVFGLLFKAASQTLLALGKDPARLGAQLGITAVLHTWTRELRFHPHLHCLVTSGGLSLDGAHWVQARSEGRFLFPVRVLSRLFRGKLLALLERAFSRGELNLDPAEPLERSLFEETLRPLRRKEWVVYAKRPFAGPKHVFRYLGRYTHRVGISNQRLLNVDEETVTFLTKNGSRARLSHEVFIGRFLQHVLPARFVKIRHFGLHASSNAKTKLEQARTLLAAKCPPERTESEAWEELCERLTGEDPRRCPACKQGTLLRYPLPAEASRPPPRGAPP